MRVFSDQLYREALKDNIYIVVADISPAGSMPKFRKNFQIDLLTLVFLKVNDWYCSRSCHEG